MTTARVTGETRAELTATKVFRCRREDVLVFRGKKKNTQNEKNDRKEKKCDGIANPKIYNIRQKIQWKTEEIRVQTNLKRFFFCDCVVFVL